jgi:hypothetical protein
MNQSAFDAVEKVWTLTVKARARCPYADESAIGTNGYISPPWYRSRGAVYIVNLPKSLSEDDRNELIEIGSFINRSFIISMSAILEAYGVVPYRVQPDRTKPGGDHAQLTKWLRNLFAHGEWDYDASNQDHVKTRSLLVKLFPSAGAGEPRFVVSIDSVLEPLKNGVLEYIQATT